MGSTKVASAAGRFGIGWWTGLAVGFAGVVLTVSGLGCFWIAEQAGGWSRYRLLAYPGIVLIGLAASLIYRERTRSRPLDSEPGPNGPRLCPTCGRSNPPDAWFCVDCESSMDSDPGQPSS